jgi:(2R)-sulfolactate sulfo-lyase subunit alpha
MAHTHKFLVHEPGDMVGVAIQDIAPNDAAEGLVMSDKSRVQVTTLNPVPLGHKVALRDIREGETVLKYGVAIGEAYKDIKQGEHVHIHNLRSIRWRASVAAN